MENIYSICVKGRERKLNQKNENCFDFIADVVSSTIDQRGRTFRRRISFFSVRSTIWKAERKNFYNVKNLLSLYVRLRTREAAREKTYRCQGLVIFFELVCAAPPGTRRRATRRPAEPAPDSGASDNTR